MSSPLFSRITSQQKLALSVSAMKSPGVHGADVAQWPDDYLREQLTRTMGRPWVDVVPDMVDRSAFAQMHDQCRDFNFLPAYQGRIALHVFMPDPFHGPAIRALRNLYHREIHPIGTSLKSLERAMSRLEMELDAETSAVTTIEKSGDPTEVLSWDYEPGSGPTFIEKVLTQAYRMGTSDVFFEQYTDRLDIRFKIAGKCLVMPPIDAENASEVISNAKAFGSLQMRNQRGYRSSSTELTMPDGNILGFRVEAQKSLDGETITFRLLDKRVVLNMSKSLPFPPQYIPVMTALLNQKQGLILVCGPTGSGKTTTLWRCLLSLNSSEKKITTIEDPVEYRIDRFVQLPVKGKTTAEDSPVESFHGAVRSCMRAAPDVILVGEIRDEETAGAAMEASLTGHLILSTIHTPDSIGAIPRLLDKKQSALNISQSLSAVISQRLVPKLCHECRIPSKPTDQQKAHFCFHGIPVPEQVYTANGCPKCSEGIRGRLPIFEFLVLDAEGKAMIASNFDPDRLREHWLANGGVSLGRNAMAYAAEGVIAYDDAAPLDAGYRPAVR